MIAAEGLFPNAFECRRPQQSQPEFFLEVRFEGWRDSQQTVRRILRQPSRAGDRLPIEQFKKPIQRGAVGLKRFRRGHLPALTERRHQPFHFGSIIGSLLRNQHRAAIGHQRAEPLAHAIGTTDYFVAGTGIDAGHPRRHANAARHAVQLRHRKALLRQHQVRADHPRRMTAHRFFALQTDEPIRFAAIQPIRNPRWQIPCRASSVNFIACLLKAREGMTQRRDAVGFRLGQHQGLGRPAPGSAAKQSARRHLCVQIRKSDTHRAPNLHSCRPLAKRHSRVTRSTPWSAEPRRPPAPPPPSCSCPCRWPKHFHTMKPPPERPAGDPGRFR